MWVQNSLLLISLALVLMALLVTSSNFFWFVILYEGFSLCFVGSIILWGVWGGFVILLLAIFCVETAMSVSLIVYYNSFKSSLSSPLFV
uniref:NADH dehydrogenase subunit 4L n=1 Tax=Syndesmis echinorum TaxID=2019369 RepID=A0A7G5XUL9_9PLAT|nr:NADH dehydrogenase subunit 4L [Syndesmis echinorum]QNA49654.1 NADH dehydrogenase subunit 4L [Syndesmis echinorum]